MKKYKRGRLRFGGGLSGWTVVMLLLAGPVAAQIDEPVTREIDLFQPGVFTSSVLCGKCHEDIYTVWRDRSVHAQSMIDPAFQAALATVSGEVRTECLVCHAPTVVITKDVAGKLAITREGVTCDFCHSLKGVDLQKEVPFDLDVGPRKRGPLRNPRLAPHEAVYSELHTSSLFCASCHEYRNRHGVAVLSTYSEWQAGPFSERKVPCQGCHMELYKAKLVAGQETTEVSRTFINLHEVPGGRSRKQLRRAMDLEISDVRNAAGQTQVVLEVSNQAAGHKVPTGLSTHSVRLEVRVITGDRVERKEEVYQRVLTDNAGKKIGEVARLFTDAAAVQSDNRIEPGRSRKVRFSFAPMGKGARIEARLIYEVAPGWPGAEGSSIEFRKVEREIQ